MPGSGSADFEVAVVEVGQHDGFGGGGGRGFGVDGEAGQVDGDGAMPTLARPERRGGHTAPHRLGRHGPGPVPTTSTRVVFHAGSPAAIDHRPARIAHRLAARDRRRHVLARRRAQPRRDGVAALPGYSTTSRSTATSAGAAETARNDGNSNALCMIDRLGRPQGEQHSYHRRPPPGQRQRSNRVSRRRRDGQQTAIAKRSARVHARRRGEARRHAASAARADQTGRVGRRRQRRRQRRRGRGPASQPGHRRGAEADRPDHVLDDGPERQQPERHGPQRLGGDADQAREQRRQDDQRQTEHRHPDRGRRLPTEAAGHPRPQDLGEAGEAEQHRDEQQRRSPAARPGRQTECR